MGPKKTWRSSNSHTPRHIRIDQLTIEHSTPLRHTSTPASSSQQTSSPQRRTVTATNADTDDSTPTSNTAELQQSNGAGYLINEQLLTDNQVEPSSFSLPSSHSNPRISPSLGQAVRALSRQSNTRTSSPAPHETVNSRTRPVVSQSLLARLRDIPQPRDTERPHQGLQNSEQANQQNKKFLNSLLSRSSSGPPTTSLDCRPAHATIGLPQHVGFVSADFLPRTPIVNLPDSSQHPTISNPDGNHQSASQGFAGRDGGTDGNVMASLPYRVSSGDARRPSRLENRPPMSTVLCRNGPQCRKFVEGICFEGSYLQGTC